MDDPEFKVFFKKVLNEKYPYLRTFINSSNDLTRISFEQSIYTNLNINTFKKNNEILIDLEQFVNYTSDNKCNIKKILKNKNACNTKDLYILKKDNKIFKEGELINDIIRNEKNIYAKKTQYLIPLSGLKTVLDSIKRFTPNLGKNHSAIDEVILFMNLNYAELLTEATLQYMNMKHKLLLDKLNDEMENNRIIQERQQKLIDLLLTRK